jgi:hypothetical protein
MPCPYNPPLRLRGTIRNSHSVRVDFRQKKGPGVSCPEPIGVFFLGWTTGNHRNSRSSGYLFLHGGVPLSLVVVLNDRQSESHSLDGTVVKNWAHAWPTTFVLGRGPQFSSLISSIMEAISEWRISSCQLK